MKDSRKTVKIKDLDETNVMKPRGKSYLKLIKTILNNQNMKNTRKNIFLNFSLSIYNKFKIKFTITKQGSSPSYFFFTKRTFE